MKEELMQRIGAVVNALNQVTVSGKANLANLSGSIAVLEEVCAMLRNATFAEPEEDDTV
jgi:hypothetical protein